MVSQAQAESNRQLAARIVDQRREFLEQPHLKYPWLFKPCLVRVLLVADGGLDFSADNFGLSTFVEILATEKLPYVRFEITAGHRDRATTGGEGNPYIAQNIGNSASITGITLAIRSLMKYGSSASIVLFAPIPIRPQMNSKPAINGLVVHQTQS